MGDSGLTQEEIDALLSGGLEGIENELGDGDTAKPASTETKPVATEAPKQQPVAASSINNMNKAPTRTLDKFENQNLSLLLDVQMSLTVELGRTKLPIKDVLRLTDGSIIELQKLAGEAVDIMVNNILLGRGVIVVSDEDYCVQITEIIEPIERFKQLM